MALKVRGTSVRPSLMWWQRTNTFFAVGRRFGDQRPVASGGGAEGQARRPKSQNVPDHRPRVIGVQYETEASSRGSVHPLGHSI